MTIYIYKILCKQWDHGQVLSLRLGCTSMSPIKKNSLLNIYLLKFNNCFSKFFLRKSVWLLLSLKKYIFVMRERKKRKFKIWIPRKVKRKNYEFLFFKNYFFPFSFYFFFFQPSIYTITKVLILFRWSQHLWCNEVFSFLSC